MVPTPTMNLFMALLRQKQSPMMRTNLCWNWKALTSLQYFPVCGRVSKLDP